MWKGLGALLTANPKHKYMVGSVAAALTVESVDQILRQGVPAYVKHGSVQSVEQGLLVLRAKTSIGMQELTLRKPLLMRILKDNQLAVRDIRIAFGFQNKQQRSEYADIDFDE